MATTMKNLLHPMQHHRDKKEGSQAHSGPLHDRNDSAMERPREEEKQTLARWEDHKHTLSPDEIDKDPETKPVGHSSKVLREEDFELIKTLGTGARRSAVRGAAMLTPRQAPLRACG
jgi:protein kinase A